MWAHAVDIAKVDRNSEIDALFISSLNDMIDLHNSRMTVFRYRIPLVIWYVLIFYHYTFHDNSGYHAGLSGKSSIKMELYWL